jgi:hypothetical protein
VMKEQAQVQAQAQALTQTDSLQPPSTSLSSPAPAPVSDDALRALQQTAERYKEEAEGWREKFETAQIRGVFHGPPSPLRSSTGAGTGTCTGARPGSETDDVDDAPAPGPGPGPDPGSVSTAHTTPARQGEGAYNPLGSRSARTPGSAVEPMYTFEETATATPSRCCHA